MITQHPKTIRSLNKFIQKEIRNTISVEKGDGYFYLYSEDKEESLFISSLPVTGIYVNRVSDLSFESWYQSVNNLINRK